MRSQIEERGIRGFEMDDAFIEIDDETLIGSARWVDGDGVIQNRYHVLTIRDGKIADMQVCGSQRQALQFVRRAARRAKPS